MALLSIRNRAKEILTALVVIGYVTGNLALAVNTNGNQVVWIDSTNKSVMEEWGKQGDAFPTMIDIMDVADTERGIKKEKAHMKLEEQGNAPIAPPNDSNLTSTNTSLKTENIRNSSSDSAGNERRRIAYSKFVYVMYALFVLAVFVICFFCE